MVLSPYLNDLFFVLSLNYFEGVFSVQSKLVFGFSQLSRYHFTKKYEICQ